MRFIALLPVRDEADIIGQCLRHLLGWSDAVYVFDTGSVDQTWALVQEAAAADRRVKPVRKEPVFFSETQLRGYLFDLARKDMEDGDWFARVDADEFHHVAPPVFCREFLRRRETCVYHQYYNFQLTASDLAAWERGDESLAGRARPIEERRRHYQVSVYSEPRLCRYRRTMRWPPSVSFPFNAGFVARARLPIRHYPHRDPPQMERRCRLRAIMMADRRNRANWARPEQHHWSEQDWHTFVVADNAPGLHYWAPGSALPRVDLTNHLRPWHVRLVQRLAHGWCLPLLDRLRPQLPDGTRPQAIPASVQAQLVAELGQLP
jgi:hypothetical protein